MPTFMIDDDVDTDDSILQTGCPAMVWSEFTQSWIVTDLNACPHDPVCWLRETDRIENAEVR